MKPRYSTLVKALDEAHTALCFVLGGMSEKEIRDSFENVKRAAHRAEKLLKKIQK